MALLFFLSAALLLVFPALNVPGMVNGLQGSEDFYSDLIRLTVYCKNESLVVKLWKYIVRAPFSSGVCHGLDAEQSRAEQSRDSLRVTSAI
jgi:hypothetical protein